MEMEVFKNLLCTFVTTDFNSLELLENKERSSRPVVIVNLMLVPACADGIFHNTYLMYLLARL